MDYSEFYVLRSGDLLPEKVADIYGEYLPDETAESLISNGLLFAAFDEAMEASSVAREPFSSKYYYYIGSASLLPMVFQVNYENEEDCDYAAYLTSKGLLFNTFEEALAARDEILEAIKKKKK